MKKTIAVLLAILMLFSLFQGALRESVAKADSQPIWPMFGYNAQRTGQCPYDTSKNNGTLKWKYEISVIGSSTIGSDGTIYVGSNGLYALSPYGVPKWKFEVNASVSSPAIATDGTIYVGGYYLYAINPDSTLKWKYETGGGINFSPAIASGGTIYTVGSNYLYAINPNGTLKWRFKTAYVITSSPAIADDGTIYVGSRDGYLYAINTDGTLKWKIDNIYTSPTIGLDGTVYVGSYDGCFYALNSNGTLKWKYYSGGSFSSPSIASDGTIYMGIYGELYAFNSSGTLKWKFKTSGNEIFSPVISSNGTIYFGANDGYFYAVNPDGTIKWKFEVNSSFSSPAISSDGTIYFSSGDYLYALGGTVNTFLSPPRNLTASVASNSSAALTWIASKPGSNPISGYAIYRGTSSGGESPTPIATVSASTNTYIDTNVTVGIAYYYYVKAFDNQSSPKYSERSNEVSGVISPHIWPAGSGYDNQRTGQCPYDTSKNNGTLKWKFETKPSYYNYFGPFPTIASDGTIYFGVVSMDPNKRYLFALSKENIVKWRFETNDNVNSYPVIAVDGTIYAGTRDGSLYAINPNGTLKWKFEIGQSIAFIVLGTGGTIYIGSGNYSPSYLYGFNPDGTLKLKIERGYTGYWFFPVLGSDGTIYAFDNRELQAFNSNGTLKWELSVSASGGSDSITSIAIAPDGTIYASGYSKIYAINPYADNPDDRIKWKYTTDNNITTFPVIAYDGTVYVGTDKGYLYALNPNGTLKWKNQYKMTDNIINYSPTISLEGTIFVGIGKTLYAINPDGTTKWKFEDNDTQTGYIIDSSPVISNDGTVYFCAGSGGSYAEGLYAIGGTSSITIKSSVSSINGGFAYGSISPSGIITVNPGESVTYHITPDEGYIISTVKVDGSPVGAVSTYTFKNVTTNHIIEAVFDKQKTYTIQASAGTGGTISSSGTITVNSGESKTFTITPNTGYKISSVKVDGVSVGAVSTYTFTNVTNSHTISATFEKGITKTVIILHIGNKNFTVNGETRTLDSPPIIKNGRTLLPIRAIIEALGGTVGWDPNEKKVTVTLGSTTIELWIGMNAALVNGYEIPIDPDNSKVVPEIINRRTMLPLRFVAESLGAKVDWDGTTQTITITYGG